MFQASDGRGVRPEMAFLRPGGPAPKRLTRTQVKWFSNLIGSWLIYGVGLSVRDAAAVLSRRVSEKHLRATVHAMAPVAALPDPNGFQNGWRFEVNPPDRRGPRPRRPRPKRRPRLPSRAPAGRGRTSTGRRTTSSAGSGDTGPN